MLRRRRITQDPEEHSGKDDPRLPGGKRRPIGPIDWIIEKSGRVFAGLKPSLPWAAAVASGVLLHSAFPPAEWSETAWLAFVPLILAARFSDARRALQLGCIAGTVFWMLSIYWLTRVTIPGWIALSLYCALYTGVFAAGASWLMNRLNTDRWHFNIVLMLAISMIWAGLEFVRSTLFTGFAWNPLGVSQYDRISIIQISTWGGVYLVSALVVMINVAIALTLLRYIQMRGNMGRRPHPELMVGFLVLALVISYGMRSVRAEQPQGEPLRVSLIQTNIPQYEKWTREFVDTIYDRLYTLTHMAINAGNPDLVIWPETAVPDFIRKSERSYDLVEKLTAHGAPILVGSMDVVPDEKSDRRFYNSSMLFSGNGELLEVYDKQHLVMFGEYVPLEGIIPFARAMTPIQASFDHGRESTVFEMDEPKISFSVLICFEDTVSSLSRRAVRKGSRMLVNQTNDAWFDPSSASRQHMTHSMFRAVENRVPLVRSANTGISCAIDGFGRISGNPLGPMTHGFKTALVDVPSKEMPLTFYTRHGDVFAWTCVAAGLMILVAGFKERKKK